MVKTYRYLRRLFKGGASNCFANRLRTRRAIDCDLEFLLDQCGELTVPFAVVEKIGQHRADAVQRGIIFRLDGPSDLADREPAFPEKSFNL